MGFFRALLVCLGVLPWAIVVVTVLVTGLALGAGLLVTVAGVPILAGTLHLARCAADLECNILRWAVAADTHREGPTAAALPGPHRFAVLRERSAWRELALLLLRLPIGIVSFTVTAVLITIPVAYLTAPLTYRWASIWGITGEVESRSQAYLAIPQGVVVAVLAAVTIPAMARLLGRTAGIDDMERRLAGVSLRRHRNPPTRYGRT